KQLQKRGTRYNSRKGKCYLNVKLAGMPCRKSDHHWSLIPASGRRISANRSKYCSSSAYHPGRREAKPGRLGWEGDALASKDQSRGGRRDREIYAVVSG